MNVCVSCVLQAPCQVELENWVNSIHSACAAAFARHRGKTGTLHLLQEEIFRLDKAIESVSSAKPTSDGLSPAHQPWGTIENFSHLHAQKVLKLKLTLWS